MANTINNINENAGIFVRAVAEKLEDECHFTKAVAKVPADELKGKNGFASGDTLNVSIPARKQPIDGFDITSADMEVKEENVKMTVDIEKTIPFDMTSVELATKAGLQACIERFAKPFASDMAQSIEEEHIKRATQATYNLVGTAGSGAYDTNDILKGRTKLNKFLCPKDKDRHLLFESEASQAAVVARTGRFQSSEEIKKQYETGTMGYADGFLWHETELGYEHANGTMGGTPLVAGASQSGSTIDIYGLSASGTVTKGTVFTIDGVYAVHPITKKTYNFLQQFTVTADATASSGAVTLSISPAIDATTTTQNVDAVPADNAAINFVGSASTSYGQGLGFHKEAFRVLSVPLEMPKNAEFQAQYTTKAGITIALVRDFDVLKRRWITRLDYLGAFKDIRPEHAVRYTT